MSLLAQLTVTALWIPLAITPPGMTPLAQLQVMAPEAAPPAAAAPVAAPPAAAPPAAAPPVAVAPTPVAPVAVAPAATVVAPAGSTVVVSDGSPTTVVTDPWAMATTTTTTTTTATTTAVTTTTTAAPAPAPAPAVSAKAAVRTLLRYDPYLAPRYRSGRNMMIGGGVMFGVGSVTLLYTLAWAHHSRQRLNHISIADERQRAAEQRNQSINAARVIGVVAGAVAVTGIVLLATGAVRKRRAIEEARGRVYMQAGPSGMQVRF